MRLVAETTYKYLKFYNRIITFRGLVWGIWGGFVIGLFLSYYHKIYLGEAVRRLLKKEATSKESAKTLAELKLRPSRLMTRALKEGATLRRHIDVANPEECIKTLPPRRAPKIWRKIFPKDASYEYDFEKMKLYIDGEKKYAAEARYEQKRRMSPLWLIVIIVVLTALAAGMMIAVPDLLQLLDNFISLNFDK